MKNFVRGMGVGILVATLILAIAYMLKRDDISDSEVIQRARKLGMVENNQSVIRENHPDGSAEGEAPTDNAEAVNPDAGSSQAGDDQAAPPSQDENAPAENQPEAADPGIPADSQPQPGEETVQVQINPGADGITICQLLQQKGVIENASDFSRYLSENDMQKYIMHGTYELQKGISYEDLVKVIIRK